MTNQFFVLTPASDRDDTRAVIDQRQPAWETVQCSLYGNVERRRIGPLAISEIPSAQGIVWTWYSDLLATDRVRRVVESSISGCSFLPVTVSGRTALSTPCLWEMRVTGFAGFASAAGGLDVRSRCDECGIYSYSVPTPFASLIDTTKWDGSDLFTIWPFPRIQICTRKAAMVLRQSDIGGVATIPIEDFDLMSGSAAPGLPSAWLDEVAVDRLMADADFINAICP